MQLNIQQIQVFFKANKLSAFRTFLIIQDKFAGNLHTYQKDELCQVLNIKRNTLSKNLRTLRKMGVLKHPKKSWYHTVSWKKWKNVECRKQLTDRGTWKYGNWEILDKETGFWHTNRSFTIDFGLLLSKGVKYLRTKIYSCFSEMAYTYLKKKKSGIKRNIDKITNAPRKSYGKFLPLSSSYIKNTTGLSKSLPTINRHTNLADKFGILEKKTQRVVLGKFDTFAGAIAFYHHQVCDTVKDRYLIKKYKGKFQVFTYNCNLIKFPSEYCISTSTIAGTGVL